MNSQGSATRLDIRPFGGTVTVRFMDAVIAASHDALIVRQDGGPDGGNEQVFIPFRDIYFDFLAKSDTREECRTKGEASLWSIQAMGRAEPDAMRSYGANETSAPLRNYGTFDPAKVAIELTPEDAPVA